MYANETLESLIREVIAPQLRRGDRGDPDPRRARPSDDHALPAVSRGERVGAHAVPPRRRRALALQTGSRPHASAAIVISASRSLGERLLAREAREQLQKAIAALPENQRVVLVLRDVEGCSTETVCKALGCQRTSVRMLLHRARAKVRAAVEPYLEAA